MSEVREMFLWLHLTWPDLASVQVFSVPVPGLSHDEDLGLLPDLRPGGGRGLHHPSAGRPGPLPGLLVLPEISQRERLRELVNLPGDNTLQSVLWCQHDTININTVPRSIININKYVFRSINSSSCQWSHYISQNTVCSLHEGLVTPTTAWL